MFVILVSRIKIKIKLNTLYRCLEYRRTGCKRVSDHIIDQVSCLVPESLITLFVSPSNARYWSNKNLKIEVLNLIQYYLQQLIHF